MKLPIRLIRWFNHAIPTLAFKRRLGDWASRRLATNRGPHVYKGIMGRHKMRLDLAHADQRQMYLNCHKLLVRRILTKVLAPGDIHVDCGAGSGYLALWAGRRVGSGGRVYAFEPMPPTAERLRENVQLNEAENIDVAANGTWDTPKTATLHAFDDRPCGHASLSKDEEHAAQRGYTVQTVRLDDVIDPPIKSIRISVAGAELATLRGAEKLITASQPHVLLTLDPAACDEFGHQSIDLANWTMKRLPDHTPHLLAEDKCTRTDWASLCDLLRTSPREKRLVWLRPPVS